MSNEIIAEKQEEKQILPTANFEAWIEARKGFIEKVNTIVVEGKDYHVIKGKKSLAKGGAEKVASIFQWKAKFAKDTEALEMLGAKPGLVALVCNLESMEGKFMGQGRGAANLAKNGGDENKTLKMAQKSAYIDAVIRASGLSDIFTQDLEDMKEEEISPAPRYATVYQQEITYEPETKEPPSNPNDAPSRAQSNYINKLMADAKVNGYGEESEALFAQHSPLTKKSASALIEKLLAL